MAYSRTTWVDGTTPLNATNMNNIEQGIVNNETQISALDASKVDNSTYQSDQIAVGSRIGAVEGDVASLQTKTELLDSDITVETSDWSSDDTFENYPYSASITIVGLTGNEYVNVLFDDQALNLDVLSPFCSTETDTIVIYARAIPDSDIIILSIAKLF